MSILFQRVRISNLRAVGATGSLVLRCARYKLRTESFADISGASRLYRVVNLFLRSLVQLLTRTALREALSTHVRSLMGEIDRVVGAIGHLGRVIYA